MKTLLSRLFRPRTKSLVRLFVAFLFTQTVWIGTVSVGLAQTSETADESTPRHVVAAVPRHWPPQYEIDDSGNPIGFAIDVMEEVAARAELTVTYLIKDSFAEAVDALLTGDADLIPNSGILPERLDRSAFTAPVETFTVSLFVRADTHGLKGVEGLIGRKLAVVETNIGLLMFGDRQDIDVQVYKDVRTALYELLSGHVDALVYPEPVIRALARQAGIEDRFKTVGGPLKEVKRGIRVRKGDVELLALLNGAVKNFVGTRAYQTIYAKWYGKPTPYWTTTRVMWAMGGFVAIVVVVMAGWRYHTVVNLSRALMANEALLRAVVDNSPAKIHIKDSEGRYTLINPQAEKLYGITDKEDRGRTSYDLFRREEADAFMAHDRAVIESGKPVEREEEWRMEDGIHTFLTVKFPIYGPNSEDGVTAVGSIGTDITERKRAEAARLEEESRFRAIFDGSSAAITLKGADNRFLLVNKTFAAWQNTEPSKMIGRKVSDFFSKEQADGIAAADRKVLETGEEIVTESIREFKDGVTRSIISHKCPIHSATGEVVAVATMLTDITERRRAEEAFRESEERFRAVVDNSPAAILLKDRDRRYLLANKCWYEWFNPEGREIFGRTVYDFYDKPHADRVDAQDREVIESGSVITREYQTTLADGRTLSTVLHKFPIRDTAGQIVAIGGIHSDMTERKQAEEELKKLNEELEKRVEDRTRELTLAKQLAETASRTKSEFLANMSHELRTPLNAIIGFSGTMKEKIFGPLANEKYEEYVEDIHDSGEHLLELINDVLDVSIIEAGKLELHEEAFDLATVAEAAVRLVKARSEKGRVRLSNKIRSDLPPLYGDERRVKQIMLNLLTNAIKFTPRNGDVTVDARVDSDGSLVIEITDTGIGMTADEIARATTPFGQVDTSLSRKYEGTGLGLPLAEALVEAHGAHLHIESKPNVGTTVTVRFPPERVV